METNCQIVTVLPSLPADWNFDFVALAKPGKSILRMYGNGNAG